MNDSWKLLKPPAGVVRTVKTLNGYTLGEMAQMTYVSGARQVENYVAGDRSMDASKFFCLVAHTMLPRGTIDRIETEMKRLIESDSK